MSNKYNKIVYVIEGNVGAGKTTLVSNIPDKKRIKKIPEKWMEESAILNKFYFSSDKKTIKLSSTAFQYEVILRFLKEIQDFIEDEDHDILIIDRGILGSISFIYHAMKEDLLPSRFGTLLILTIYDTWTTLLSIYRNVLFHIVYLDTNYLTCHSRVVKREEAAVACNLSREKLCYISNKDEEWLRTIGSLHSTKNQTIIKLFEPESELEETNLEQMIKFIEWDLNSFKTIRECSSIKTDCNIGF
jgi:deoxyadenosine/deoxycytidine kinase